MPFSHSREAYGVKPVFPSIPEGVVTETNVEYEKLRQLLEGRYKLSLIGSVGQSSIEIQFRPESTDIEEIWSEHYPVPSPNIVCNFVLSQVEDLLFVPHPISDKLVGPNIIISNDKLHRERNRAQREDPFYGFDIHYRVIESIRLNTEIKGSEQGMRIILLPSETPEQFDIFRLTEKFAEG